MNGTTGDAADSIPEMGAPAANIGAAPSLSGTTAQSETFSLQKRVIMSIPIVLFLIHDLGEFFACCYNLSNNNVANSGQCH